MSAAGLLALASTANRRQAGDGEKVLAFGLTLLPDAHALHQALARAQASAAPLPTRSAATRRRCG